VRTLHIGLRVGDREASVGFYRDLGYEVIGTVAETPVGHLTMLKLPSDEFVTLEVVSAPDTAPGLSHLVVATESLDATIRALDVRGIHAKDTSPPPHRRTMKMSNPEYIGAGNTTRVDQSAISPAHRWRIGHYLGERSD